MNSKGIFIVGTDTDVGKTFITAGIISALRNKNIDAVPFKAVASGGPVDLDFFMKVCKLPEERKYNTYCFQTPVSPHLASEIENIKIDLKVIQNDYQVLKDQAEFVIAEGAGGLIVPIIRDQYYIPDLIRDLELPVVLVARAGVGTINHTCLTIEALKSRNISVKGIILNQYSGSDTELDNIKIIESLTNTPIIARVPNIDVEVTEDNFYDLVGKHLSNILEVI